MDNFIARANDFRKKIYDLLFNYLDKNLVSSFYDFFIAIIAIISVLPLMFTSENIKSNSFLTFIQNYQFFWLTIFTIDYILKFITADFKIKKGIKSFLIYPFTIWGIIDLIAIVPGWTGNNQYQAFISLRLLRVVNFSPRISKSINFVLNSIFSEWRILLIIFITLIFFVFIGAIIIFNVEYGAIDNSGNESKIKNFWDAFWFVFVTITTIGYGDITPVTNIGKVIVMIFSLLGISLIALLTATTIKGFDKQLKQLQMLRLSEKENKLKNVDYNLNKFTFYFKKLNKKQLKFIIEENSKFFTEEELNDFFEIKKSKQFFLIKENLFNKIKIKDEDVFELMNVFELRRILKSNKINFLNSHKREELLRIAKNNKAKIKFNIEF